MQRFPLLAIWIMLCTGIPHAWADAPQPMIPAGPYHFGLLLLPRSTGAPIELYLQMREGKVVATHALTREPSKDGPDTVVNLGHPSERAGGMRGANVPDQEFWDCSELRLADGKLRGTIKLARPPMGWEALRFTIEATVKDGVLSGTAPGQALSGWLRDSAQLRQANALAPGADWPQFGGPGRDWCAPGSGETLVKDLRDLRLCWFSEEIFGGTRDAIPMKVGDGMPWVLGGMSSPIVAGGRLYFNTVMPNPSVIGPTIGRKLLPGGRAEMTKIRGSYPLDGDDVVFCLDAATGQTLWKQVFPNATLPLNFDKHGAIGNTGCYHQGRVYMMSWMYRLRCLDGATGKLLWEAPLPRLNDKMEALRKKVLAEKTGCEFGATCGNLCAIDGIIFTTADESALFAFDAATGKLLWQAPAGRTPQLTRWTSQGRQWLLVATDSGSPTETSQGKLACLDPRTGKEIWSAAVLPHPRNSSGVHGDYYVGCGGEKAKKEIALAGYHLTETGVTKLWEQSFALPGPMNIIDRVPGTLAFADGFVYAFLNRREGASVHPESDLMVAVNLQDGKVVAQRANLRGMNRGWLLAAGSRLLWMADGTHENTHLTLFNRADLAMLGPAHVPQPNAMSGGYDEPIDLPCVDGRLFIRGKGRIYCWDLRAK